MADTTILSVLLDQLERIGTLRTVIRSGAPATALASASRVAEILDEIDRHQRDDGVAAEVDVCRQASIPYFAACYGGLRLGTLAPHIERVVTRLEQSLIAASGRAMTAVA